ncbi:MAG: PhoU domain-containing protein [Candidatus ainarchaeum sp.]|nr:PhoU domain-containing protein [Candidatus ainarchaeum sp.]
MPTRRVQLTGKETFTVSLPKGWAVKNKLSPGSEVRIEEENDGTLRVSLTSSAKRREEALVRLDGVSSPEALQRLVIAKYLNGFDVIRVVSQGRMPPAFRQAAEMQAGMLTGLEVVEVKEDEVTLQDFLAKESVSIPRMLRRAYAIASSMHGESVESLLSGDAQLAAKVSKSEDDVDRVRYLITRQLNFALNSPSLMGALGLSATACLDFHIVAENVEEIGDSALEIASFARKGSRASKKAAGFARQVTSEVFSLHSDAVKAFYAANFSLADSVVSRQSKLGRRTHERENELISQAERPPWLTTFTSESLKIAGHAAEIAKIVIDKGT